MNLLVIIAKLVLLMTITCSRTCPLGTSATTKILILLGSHFVIFLSHWVYMNVLPNEHVVLVFILKLQITLWLYVLNLIDNFNVLFGITASF
jgi:hypothetical protein